MAKRYIDTNLWGKKWFREMDPLPKTVWFYLITKCDHAGILDFDVPSMNFHINDGSWLKEDFLTLFKQLGERVVVFEDEKKIWVKNFIDFQYNGLENLNPNVRPQKAVIDRLVSQGLLDKSEMTFTDVSSFTSTDTRKPQEIIEGYKKELVEKFGDRVEVDFEIEKMVDWLKTTGKRKKDYEAFARNWCRSAIGNANPAKKSTRLSLADFKKETGGFNIGYCFKCGEHTFYNDREIWGDSKCCHSRILPKRRETHQKEVDKKIALRKEFENGNEA